MKTFPAIIMFLISGVCFNPLQAQKSKLKPIGDQYGAIDNKALQLPDSFSRSTDKIAKYVAETFKADSERVRAVFIWISAHFEYDVANMFAMNFYETREEKINKLLQTRKGICENYAALFEEVCNKAGIPARMVIGYTRQNGFTDFIPHAWNAAMVDSVWYLFDPTWGSGYINNGRFYRKIDNNFFKVRPSVFIKSHMPFDPMWEFLYYPITNQEFYAGQTQQANAKPFFNFTDSINAFQHQDSTEQITCVARRIESNGVKNSMIFDELQHLKMKIEMDRQSVSINLYNGAVADANEASHLFNEFINYRNKQFTPSRSDAEIKKMVNMPAEKLDSAKTKISKIENPGANILSAINQLNNSIRDMSQQINEQQEWVRTYMSKGKMGRKMMFYQKITLGKTESK